MCGGATSLAARAPHTCTECSCMYHKPWRLNWPLAPGRGGSDEGLATGPEGWMEGTDEKLREKRRENPGNKRGKSVWDGLAAFDPRKFSPPPPALPSCHLFYAPSRCCLFFSPLFHSLGWRLPVAMATAEEETIPEERRRGCRRSRLRREDVLWRSG